MSSATLSPAISYKSPKRKSDTIYSTSSIDIKQVKFIEDEEILILYCLIFTSEKTDLRDILMKNYFIKNHLKCLLKYLVVVIYLQEIVNLLE